MNALPSRVLLVESDDTLRESLARFLVQTHDFECILSTSYADALAQAANALPPFELVLIDDQLPCDTGNELVLRGVELVGELNDLRHPPTAVVFTRIPPPRERAVLAHKTGVAHYVIKPFRLKQLGNILKRAAELRQYKLTAEQRAMLEQMKTLAELTRNVNASLELDQVLTETCRAVQHLVGADHSGLVLFEPNLEYGYVQAEYPVLGIGRRKIPLRGIPLEEQLIQSQKPVPIASIDHETELGIVKSTLLELGIQSILLVPILVKNQVVGSLSLDFMRTPHVFTPTEIELCEFFAAQIAPAIENARLFKQERKRAAEFDALRTTMLQMTRSSRQDLLKTILQQAVQLLHARDGGIYSFAREWNELHLIDELRRGKLIGTVLHVGEGVAGRLILEGDYLIVKDYGAWPGRARQFDSSNDLQAVLGVPLKWENERIGVLCVEAETARDFTTEDVNLLQLFADQAAIALKTAEQTDQDRAKTERLKRLAEILPEIIKPLGGGALDDRLDLIAETIVKLLNAETGGVFVREDPRSLKLESSYGHRAGGFQKGRLYEIRSEMKSGLTGHIAFHKKSFVARGTQLQDYYAVQGSPPHTPSGKCLSLLAEPILRPNGAEDELLGLLRADNKKGADGRAHERICFDDDDAHILRILAAAARYFLEQAQWELEQRAQQARRERTVNALQQISRAMVSGDLKATLEAAAEGVKDASGCDVVVLYRYDPIAAMLEHPPVYTEGLSYPDAVARFEQVPRGSIVYKMMERDAPYIVNDVQADPLFRARSFAVREQIRSVIALPLRFVRRTVGVLFVNFHAQRNFDDADLDLLQMFADQAAVAIDNARFEQTLAKLYESAKTITGKSTLAQILPAIAKRAIELLDNRDSSPHCFSYIALKHGEELEFVAASSEEWLEILRHVRPIQPRSTPRGIIGRAVYDKSRYQNVPNIFEDPDYIQLSPLTRSQLVVMIKSGDEVIGALGIEHGAADAFTANDVKKVKMLSSQTALAIEIAQAHDEASWRARKFNALLNITQMVGASKNLDETLSSACRAAVEFLKVDHSGLVLFDETLSHGRIEADYPPSEIVGSHMPVHGIPIEEQLVRERKPIYIANVPSEASFGPIQAVLEKLGTRSLLLIPIIVQDKLIGSFGLDTIGKPRSFSPEEKELCIAFAGQMGVAIERARLYDERNREAEHLELLQRENRERDQFIELLEHLHINSPGFAISSMDLILQGELGRLHLTRKQYRKLEAVREDLRWYKDFQEILRHAGRPYEAGRPRAPVSLKRVVKDVVGFLASGAANKGIRLATELRADACVLANYERLTVAVLQLVANAIKYSPRDGAVTIAVERRGEWIELYVDDEGPGVPENLKAQLGKAGFRVDPQVVGSGVGLAFAMGFIREYGGEIQFPSKTKPGLLVVVRFPVVECESEMSLQVKGT